MTPCREATAVPAISGAPGAGNTRDCSELCDRDSAGFSAVSGWGQNVRAGARRSSCAADATTKKGGPEGPPEHSRTSRKTYLFLPNACWSPCDSTPDTFTTTAPVGLRMMIIAVSRVCAPLSKNRHSAVYTPGALDTRPNPLPMCVLNAPLPLFFVFEESFVHVAVSISSRWNELLPQRTVSRSSVLRESGWQPRRNQW